MSNLTIPVILAATIAVAAMFALAPIEQASTVHVSTGIQSISAGADDDTLDTPDLIADSATIKTGTICHDTLESEAADDGDEFITVEVSSDGTETVTLGNELEDDGGEGCATFTGYRLFVGGTVAAGDTLSWAAQYQERTP